MLGITRAQARCSTQPTITDFCNYRSCVETREQHRVISEFNLQHTLTKAWLLHSRPYKERSVIAEFLVEDHGRIAMVVRGVRQARSANAALLQPFNRVLISWRGRGELKTLVQLEADTNIRLSGNALYCGFYVNELLLRAMVQGQNLEGVGTLYELVINRLAANYPVEPLLRTFELELLELAGYAPELNRDMTGVQVKSEGMYQLIPETGIRPVSGTVPENIRALVFSGEQLQALVHRDFSKPELYSGFKRFTRLALRPLIGDRPLQSRSLFQSSGQSKAINIDSKTG